ARIRQKDCSSDPRRSASSAFHCFFRRWRFRLLLRRPGRVHLRKNFVGFCPVASRQFFSQTRQPRLFHPLSRSKFQSTSSGPRAAWTPLFPGLPSNVGRWMIQRPPRLSSRTWTIDCSHFGSFAFGCRYRCVSVHHAEPLSLAWTVSTRQLSTRNGRSSSLTF